MIKREMVLAKMKAFTIVDNVIWGCMLDVNALVKIYMNNWKVEYIGRFPNQNKESKLFYQVKYCNGKLFFGPTAADNIIVYDIKASKFIEIKLNDINLIQKEYNANFKFENMEVCNNKIFFIPTSYPAFIELDSVSMTMKYISEPFMDIKKIDICNGRSRQYFNCVFRKYDILYIGFNNANAWIEFNMKTSQYCIKTLDLPLDGIWTVAKIEDYFIFTSFDHNKAYELNGKFCNEILELEGKEIFKVCEVKNWVLFFLKGINSKSSIIRFNKSTKVFKHIGNINSSIVNVEEKGDDIWILCSDGTKFVKYNSNNDQVQTFPYIKLDKNTICNDKLTPIIIDEREMNLRDFFGLITGKI